MEHLLVLTRTGNLMELESDDGDVWRGRRTHWTTDGLHFVPAKNDYFVVLTRDKLNADLFGGRLLLVQLPPINGQN